MRLNINYELLISFLQRRNMAGIPTKIDIIYAINKTKTRSVFPEGWEWK